MWWDKGDNRYILGLILGFAIAVFLFYCVIGVGSDNDYYDQWNDEVQQHNADQAKWNFEREELNAKVRQYRYNEVDARLDNQYLKLQIRKLELRLEKK